MKGRPVSILLAEDNPDHAELFLRSLRDHHVANVVTHVSDGEAALNYLNRTGEFADTSRSAWPHVFLLDLRLPKIDGLEVLSRVKSSETLRKIPVVVLTTSAADCDIERAYELGANSYVVKPSEFTELSKMLNDLGFYWLTWNQPPDLQ
jgi:CheY-like chemotaxis protein